MADKVRDNQQWKEISGKYLGVGNADSGREVLQAQRADTLASLAHHDHLVTYTAFAQHVHPDIARQQMRKKIVNDE